MDMQDDRTLNALTFEYENQDGERYRLVSYRDSYISGVGSHEGLRGDSRADCRRCVG